MPLMMDAKSLQPYLDAVRTTRAARLAVVNARNTWPEPHTAEQTAAYKRAYKAADHVHTDACARLARQVACADRVGEAAEG